MNRDFRAAELGGADMGGENDRGENEHVEALALADPAGVDELPPEHLDAWLDRLVDGEVAEPQRRALLSRLEQSPDGWRHCALAFLEAQAWREALEPGAVGAAYDNSQPDAADETPARLTATVASQQEAMQHRAAPQGAAPHRAAPHSAAQPRLAWHWGPLLGIVAAAASFVVAFALGLLMQRTWLSPKSPHAGAAGTVVEGARSASTDPPTVAGSKPPQWGAEKWGTVQFVVDGPGGSPQQVRLPAVEGPDPAQWLREQPPAIPDEVVQELRRRGHHVQTQRRYVPVPLDDGRSAVFPFDQVEVRFRGGNGYQ
jgi:hypothetical protein